jgi:hypothetical protein
MHPACGPGQPGHDKHGDPHQDDRSYHITTVSRGGRDVTSGRPSNPWR